MASVLGAGAALSDCPFDGNAVTVLASLLRGCEPDPDRAAAALLTEFGCLGATLKGSSSRMRRVAGSDALNLLRRVDAALGHVLIERVQRKPAVGEWESLIAYLRVQMQHRPTEQVRVLHLNARKVLIKDEIFSEGTVNQATVHVRELVARCLELGTSAIILAHNHPSGDPTPSRADIALTQQVIDAARHFDIQVHDHLIIGLGEHVSLRSRGLM
ncbi:JAB domain-containing protein [Sphingomonas dokdonensis]|uniref:JAB domain-containing protein n=1 Tax=Sphingomonas dokdonensis TaxID=344880 RepID=UPI0013038AE9|nr:DNA repair protein RadC [Sphingomonas dokdonensis]